jgi:hypothetical protein
LRAGAKKPDSANKPVTTKKPDPTDTGNTQSAGAARNP